MGRSKDLSDFSKGQIVMARLLGQSISETARLVGCSRLAVVSTYRQYSEEEQTTNRRQGVGHPRLIDVRGQRRLSRLDRTDRRSTVAQVTEYFNGGHGRNVSRSTVHRTLLRMGLRSRRLVRVPMMTPVHHRKRLQWACKRWNCTLERWIKVVSSNESRFLLDHVDGRVRVHRLPGVEGV